MGILDKFSGKDKYKSAVSKYSDISQRYEQKKKDYQLRTDSLNKELVELIEKINVHKKTIQSDLFSRLVELLSLLKDVEIPPEFTEEKYKEQCRKLDSYLKIRTRDTLFEIDFDKNKIKTTLQTIFTLGIWTRKKAKESEHNVDDEVAAIQDEMRRMDSEIAKYMTCVHSAKQIEYYFVKMISLFEKWLRYLEHSMNYMGYAAMRLSKRIVKKSISISFLHEQQQKELEATINLGRTLSKMIQTQIVLKKDGDNLKEYASIMKGNFESYTKESNARETEATQ